MNWLLILVPVTIALELLVPDRHFLIFVVSALAILPLAAWLGRATEQLAERMGEGIGGLLNATFGNAAELIIALAALRAGLHDVVKASIAALQRVGGGPEIVGGDALQHHCRPQPRLDSIRRPNEPLGPCLRQLGVRSP